MVEGGGGGDRLHCYIGEEKEREIRPGCGAVRCEGNAPVAPPRTRHPAREREEGGVRGWEETRAQLKC